LPYSGHEIGSERHFDKRQQMVNMSTTLFGWNPVILVAVTDFRLQSSFGATQMAESAGTSSPAGKPYRFPLVMLQANGTGDRPRRLMTLPCPDAQEPRLFVPNPLTPVTALPLRTLAMRRRRVRVALLIEEEGLERGAIARIAGWLGVSPTTISRDIHALLAAGDPIVTAAADRENRRQSNGGT
jgi:hypothetical protein